MERSLPSTHVFLPLASALCFAQQVWPPWEAGRVERGLDLQPWQAEELERQRRQRAAEEAEQQQRRQAHSR